MKSAVEWLAIELYEKMEMRGDGNIFDEIFEKAEEMFKQQFIDAYQTGTWCIEDAEKYYNAIFKEEI